MHLKLKHIHDIVELLSALLPSIFGGRGVDGKHTRLSRLIVNKLYMHVAQN